MAQAAEPLITFDPANDTHFGVSEADEYRLRQVARAIETVGDLFEGLDLAAREEITGTAVAGVLRAFSYGVTGALDAGAFVFPRSSARSERRA